MKMEFANVEIQNLVNTMKIMHLYVILRKVSVFAQRMGLPVKKMIIARKGSALVINLFIIYSLT